MHSVDGSFKFTKIVLLDTPLQEYEIEHHIVRSAHDNKIVVSQKSKDFITENKFNSI
jgi:hypothetical protein